MKVYDDIFCDDEYQGLPAWVAVDLSGEDLTNIEYTKFQFSRVELLHTMSYTLAGSYDFEGDYPLHDPILHVSRTRTWVELQHRYDDNIEFDLGDYAVSTDYVWNGEEVVEA